MEGINNQPNNQMTLHSGTSHACTLNTKGTFTGQVLNSQCYSTQTADAGCSILDTATTSFAYGFNAAQGGVFAFLWDTSAGMSMWHFTRTNIPADITNKAPTPTNWGTPAGAWSSATCDIIDNFYNHSMVIDTTICGGWAGGAYGASGCPGTCSEMVANASNFASELVDLCRVVLLADVRPFRRQMGDQLRRRVRMSNRTVACRSRVRSIPSINTIWNIVRQSLHCNIIPLFPVRL